MCKKIKLINETSKIRIGTANFNINYGFQKKAVKKYEISKIFNLLQESKIINLDTAIGYNNSDILKKYIFNKKFNISTKLPSINNNNSNPEKWFKENFAKCLDYYGNKIDIIYLHDPKILYKKKNHIIWSLLEKAKVNKLVNKIGFSVYNKLDLIKLLNFSPDVVQIPINVFDQSFIKNNFLKNIKKKKIQIEARSIFLQGTLTSNLSEIKKNNYLKKWHDKYESWEKWVIKNNISKIQACLSFCYQLKQIDKIILGINNKNNLLELLQTEIPLDLKFPNFTSSKDFNLTKPYKWKK